MTTAPVRSKHNWLSSINLKSKQTYKFKVCKKKVTHFTLGDSTGLENFKNKTKVS